jgi:hypothetical protein
MILLIMRYLQGVGGETGIPEAGIRISIWIVGMFFLAVGAALLYMRMREAEGEDPAGATRKKED